MLVAFILFYPKAVLLYRKAFVLFSVWGKAASSLRSSSNVILSVLLNV